MNGETVQGEMLIVEDLMLLLLDDATGSIAVAGTLFYTLGGAMLVDLALRGQVEFDDTRAGSSGAKVHAVAGDPPSDPLLQSALARVARRPRDVQTLLLEVGAGLYDPVIDRLLERGLIRRDSKRALSVFRMTSLTINDTRHEAELLERVRAVLEDGESPDARTAAMIGLLSSSGALPTLHPAITWTTAVHERAKDLRTAAGRPPP
ncbi:GPP34 family phosphoprotein [Saxibacter everestensis]|uniref:GPP34 family phosphoprotein n=1 Tax=Saxibacter everestensis TaxID=2909229 RepID=A0ABY8QXT9_9MICO|nr:GPP34 family phosphoprotein [Brevibacteriaceae bacterium ZFBP1038]